ncbi:hypothetical protein N665_1041s0002 [Sinapis alba]|nr:hypothetical protein N665_1041s0002 [Sinapis alba]
MFADKLEITMEVYIDDMLVKSLIAKDHIQHLSECFETLNKYRMKLNPAKCTFGVTSGEFLGYIVTQRGIEANPKQISAVLDLPDPKMSREIQRLNGRVAALNRFISRCTDKCLPFYELLRGNKKFLWDEACEKAFATLKRYLTTPPKDEIRWTGNVWSKTAQKDHSATWPVMCDAHDFHLLACLCSTWHMQVTSCQPAYSLIKSHDPHQLLQAFFMGGKGKQLAAGNSETALHLSSPCFTLF